jgi:beta-galactosidase
MTIKMLNLKLIILMLLSYFSISLGQNQLRQVYNMDLNWKFSPGDFPEAELTGFNDGNWRTLNLPHDWSIEQVVDENEPSGGKGGYFPTGIGWYRKTFSIPHFKQGNRVIIEFDGVQMNSEVWINNNYLGKRPNGYIGFNYDITSFLKKGENVIAVKVDNSLQQNSRWYTGSGIYRHVRLEIYQPLHIKNNGVYVTTPEIKDGRAIVNVKVNLSNEKTENQQGNLIIILKDENGTEVAREQSVFELQGNSEIELVQNIQVNSPKLWNLESPHLYQLKTIITDLKNRQIDELTTNIGIREIKYDVDKGFFLNGKHIKMYGVNIHQDGGPVGVAVPAGVWERRLEILKQGGCNAIRTAHNPMASEFYDLCDRMGFLVMNEAFDEWQMGKVPEGYNKYFDEWYEKDLVSFIHRDRNHPSVVMWSVGNEIREQSKPDGYKILTRLVDICHREDPTRPVTLGCDQIAADNGSATLDFLNALDIVGYNYPDRWHERRELMYSIDRHNHPDWKMIGTETSGLGGVRGSYSLGMEAEVARPDYNYQMIRIEQRWKFTSLYDYIIGDFMWTGIDYYGETRWPGRGSNSGILDNCGFPKDGYYFFQSHWKREGEPMIHLFPHWNWEGREGQVIPVLCYSNCESVELFLNGKSYGEKRMEFPRQGNSQSWNQYDNPQIHPTTADLHLSWDVPYEPGTLKVIGKRNGEIVSVEEVSTAGKPASIRLTLDHKKIKAHPEDVVHIIAEVVDANGIIVPTASNHIKFEIQGDAQIIGVENGDMKDQDNVKSSERKAFNGLCLAIIQSQKAGNIKVTAISDGIKSASLDIDVEAVKLMPSL